MKTVAFAFPLLASAVTGANALLRHGGDGVNNMEIVSTKPIDRELDWDYVVDRPEGALDATEAPAADADQLIPREREMISCSNQEELVKLTFNTDASGSETSWILSKAWNNNVVDKSDTGSYGKSQGYVHKYCLKSDKDYSLVVKDSHGDGMCCTQGKGSFTVEVQKSNGNWKTLASGGSFSQSVTEVFTVPDYSSSGSTSNNNSSGNNSNNNSSGNNAGSQNLLSGFTSRMGCPSGQRMVQMEMKVDMYGKNDQVAWILKDVNSGKTLMESKNGGLFENNEYEKVQKCLSAGQYEIVISDAIGDGICCNYGEGYYKFSMEDNGVWDEIIDGGNFKSKTKSHFVFIGSTFMDSRAEEWLAAHNSRRQYWHKTVYKTSYVPLKWSTGLAESAQKYAESLLNSCDSTTIIHDHNNSYGENMAKNKGSGSWGELKPADNIVARFVDREVDVAYPGNAHLTQALWRASKYVGCGDSVKDHNGGKCRIQVCRYSKPGNCSINANTWESKMLEDDSGCEPSCPPEGCF